MTHKTGLLVGGLVLAVVARDAAASSYDERPAVERAAFTAAAVAANVLPVVSAFYAPACLPGYVVCKLLFAGVSVVAAGEQVLMGGGQDDAQTQAILHRGFGGDWFLTGRHIAGERKAEPLPTAPPPASAEPVDATTSAR